MEQGKFYLKGKIYHKAPACTWAELINDVKAGLRHPTQLHTKIRGTGDLSYLTSSFPAKSQTGILIPS